MRDAATAQVENADNNADDIWTNPNRAELAGDDLQTTTQAHLPVLLSSLHTCRTTKEERGREKTRERENK